MIFAVCFRNKSLSKIVVHPNAVAFDSKARFTDRLEDLEVSGSSGSSGFCHLQRHKESNVKNQKMEEVQKRLLAMQKLLENEGLKHPTKHPAIPRKGRHSVPASFQSQAGDRL